MHNECNAYRVLLTLVVFALCQMTGDMVPVEAMSIIGMSSLRDRLTELVRRVRELRLDLNEYICLKYILLLNPGLCHTAFFCVKGLFALTI